MAGRSGYSFEDAWDDARRRSLIAVALLGEPTADRRASPRDESFSRRIIRPVFRCTALGAGVPVIINVVLWGVDRRAAFVFAMDPSDYPLGLALLVVTIGMLVAGWAGLRFVDDRKDELDLTLRSRAEQQNLERFVTRYFSWWVQSLFVAAFIAALFIWMAIWAEVHSHEFSVGGRISALWAVVTGALCLHWCLPLPAVLDKLLRPSTQPHLIPYDPASTPWVGVISRLISLGGGLMSALAALAALLSASLTITRRPADPGSVVALASDMLPFVTLILIVTAAWFWVIPGWQLTSIVTDRKRRELARIQQHIDDIESAERDSERRFRLVEEYRLVSSAADSPFTSQRVAQYATLAAALIGVLLSPLLKLFFGVEIS